ncbi:toxin-antitoxin system HicB family antitoxin [Enterobacter sp. RVSM5a]|nr:toxin-antitoxin system HicB family antitoxin [Enterobacter sp. RVSM5a]
MDRWPHVNHIARKKNQKGGGQSPQFKMRIDPALKEQLDAVAAEEGVSLASWLKELAREALRAKGISPKA